VNSESVWLVTGGTRGIGAGVVEKALAEGHRVAVLARNLPSKLYDTDAYRQLQADVADAHAVEAAVTELIATWGRLDVVVNNAGLHRGGKVNRLPEDDWQAVLNTNLTGPLNVIRACEPHLQAGSAIINIGAVVGFRGFPGDVAYASSKAGLSGMTRALAIEFAKKQVTVNLVIPGLVLTEMTSGLSDKALDSMRAMIPMARFGEPSEIAHAVYSVAGARYMTGAFIPVDGGLMSTFGNMG